MIRRSYTRINWSAIAKIELYEDLVLQEAQAYISSGKLDEAYANLEFLHKNYSDLAGLQLVTENYLQQDALSSYSEERYDESLAILSALYDVNPQRQGLTKAVEGVSNRLIRQLMTNRDLWCSQSCARFARQWLLTVRPLQFVKLGAKSSLPTPRRNWRLPVKRCR